MNMLNPIRLSGAEEGLIAQLEEAGATAVADTLRERGLPTRRVEAYHYTDLKMLLGAVPPPARKAIVGASPLRLPGAYRVLVANGVVESHAGAPEGVSVRISTEKALSPREDVLVNLNRALQGETLEIAVSGSVDTIIHIDRRLEGSAGHSAGASRIVLAPGASATIVETISGSEAAHLSNGGTAIVLGEGAVATHVIVDCSARAATQFGNVDYTIAAGVRLTSLVVHAGADLSRTQIFAQFEGEGAHADFRGLNLADDGQHSDITLEAIHGVPNTTSSEQIKQIARGRSKAVFQGRIVVARDAQKTDAKMMMQGLMLSDEAEILAKPELEIFADDVVCGHGATCGSIDEDWLFYLVSRGIPREEAETMLVRAFLAEVLDVIESESLTGVLETVVDAWLGRAA